MGATADEVLIKIKAEGWKAAAQQIKATEKALRDAKKTADKKTSRDSFLGRLGSNLQGLPAKWRAGEAGATQFRRTLSGISGDVGRLTRGLAGTATSIAGIGGALTVAGGGAGLASFVKSGLELNAQWQSMETSFSTLMGSAEKGAGFMERLEKVSEGTGRKLTDVMGGAQKLFGQEMNEEQAFATLGPAMKAILATGGNNEQFQSAVRTLGQIWGNQKVSLEDINQLSEGAGLNVRGILARGIKYEDGKPIGPQGVADIGNLDVPSGKALDVILKAWEEKYSEAAENAKGNWEVQMGEVGKSWDRLRKNTTKGLFLHLNQRELPALQTFMRQAGDIMADETQPLGDKLGKVWSLAKTDLGPLAEDLRTEIAGLELDRRIGDALQEHGPKVASTMAGWIATGIEKGVPAIASGAWSAIKGMSWQGKAVTVAFLWNRLRLPFWGVGAKGAGLLAKGLWASGKLALGPVGAKLGQTAGAQAAKSATETAALRSMLLGDAIKAKAGPGMSKAGGLLGKALGVGLVAGAVAYVIANNDKISEKIGGQNKPVTLSDGTVVDAWGQYRSAKRVKDRESFGEGDLRTLAAVGRSQGMSEGEIASKMDELRRRTEYRPRATGGTVRPGEFTIVGERGPEFARFPAGTEITPNRQARLQTAGAGRGRVTERVIREQPIVLQLDSRTFYEAMSRQTEIVELRH